MFDFKEFIDFVRSSEMYNTTEFIPLHAPVFKGNEKKYLNECIDSTFVSSVGKFVDSFEKMCAQYTGAKYAVAAVNGTAALHISLLLAGVKPGHEVITQPLTFVATSNAISYTGASPIFIDVDIETMGLSPDAVLSFLKACTEIKNGECVNKSTGKVIKACVPMHTFGFPCRIDKLKEICDEFKIELVEDSAESLGSFYKGKHTGTFGLFGVLSFNGNKTITCGGGGMILTDNEELAVLAKHMTTTAKISHRWEYVHDMIGYNYRLTNLSAAIGCAQMEQIDMFITNKRDISDRYNTFFKNRQIQYVVEPINAVSNYWLNAILLDTPQKRDDFLNFTNDNCVMTRPIWRLMHCLKMFKNCQCGNLDNSTFIEQRLVNIPSSVRGMHDK